MKRLMITTALALFMLTANAQRQAKLVADETELVTLKSSFKVETSNETIFKLLQAELKDIMLKYSVSVKHDRKGSYNLFIIPFKAVDLKRVNDFFVKINK